MFASVTEAVEEIKAGRMVVVVDDEDGDVKSIPNHVTDGLNRHL